MDKWKAFFASLGAVIVPVFEYLYGRDEAVIGFMTAVLFFVVLDWMSGISAAKQDNSYGSRYGLEGIWRTFFILLLPAGGHLLDVVFKMPGLIFGALSLGTLYHVIQSMVANSIRAGWGQWVPLPVFNWLINWVKSELDKKMERAESRKGADQP
ncbi:phage holin family protein [Paenibacillus pabuli]|uniref:phage holin family protein n=1 Tax=Paenibacillus pabuli TaxID=1472 RepID=UPI000784EF73|nr:phage holin family protein [Paenibacillus pabuli]MEC0127163.1 phage holin family protein [Paenibacillus pabuli]